MKKLLMSASMAAMFGAMIPAAQAATVGPTAFTVQVTLDARCTITAGAGNIVNFGSYTAFGAAATAPTVNFTYDCTRNLTTPVISFDGATNNGVVAGLNYVLTTTGPTKTATGLAATGTPGSGSADTWTVGVGGTMAASQAGSCGGTTQTLCNVATIAARTLLFTY